MPYVIEPLTDERLCALAESRPPTDLVARSEADALPPSFVAARALRLHAAGCPSLWCSTYLMVCRGDQRIVGGCGFKGAPVAGQVEIGYGVSPACRRQGAATGAVRLLLELAFAGGASSVLAEVEPDNIASTGVVQTLGFVSMGSRIDGDGVLVVQWVRRA